VRYVGCSNYNNWQLMEAALVARHAGLSEYISVQPHWSLVEREEFEKNVLPVATKLGIGILPYSPLGRGFLTGKYRRGQPLPESKRLGSVQKLLSDRNFDLLDKLEELGRLRGKSAAQMALGWLLTKDLVAAPIIGVSTVEHLTDGLGAVGLRLSESEMRTLDALTAWEKA